MEKQGLGCFKCGKSFNSSKSLIRHISLNYPYLNKYECIQSNCSRSFNDINGLRKHYSVSHSLESSHCSLPAKNIPLTSDVLDNVANNTNTNENPTLNSPRIFDVEKTVINFIAKLYSNPTLNRKNVQTIFDDITELFNNLLEHIHYKLTDADAPSVTFREESESINKIFENLKSEYRRLKFFEKSDSFISPESFHIGTQTILDNISTPGMPGIKSKTDHGQKLSIKLRLKKFVELPNVFNELLEYINNSNKKTEVITSIIQGHLWRNIENKFTNKTFFPLLLFYDDFEPCNPLGSRAVTYKIGAVYISLACLPPQYASTLENIFLAQLTYSSDREFYGNRKVFSNLIDDLKYLEREGLNVTVNDEVKKVYFPLILILGDNLGLNSMLGFSESFSSDYFCRFCITQKNKTKVEICSSKFVPRTLENYDVQCTELSYGVKEKCIFNDLENFHVITNVYCDLMHDIFEGVLRYDMANLIDELIKKKYFDLSQLNNRIKFFKYSKADLGNTVPPIKADHLKKKHLVMSASEMLCFSLYFGILVGDLVPENDCSWEFYLVIREMLELLLSRSFTKDNLEKLGILIKKHNGLFIELFNESLKPKHHIILHYPEIISQVGPLRNIWCMRFEAYHKNLKSTVSATTCRKNLLKTLIIKESLKFSYKISAQRGFTKNYDFKISDQSVDLFSDMDFSTIFSENAFCVSWIIIDSIYFKLDFLITLAYKNVLPEYGQIKYIILDNEKVYFIVKKLFTIGFLKHIYAFEVESNQVVDQKLHLYDFSTLNNLFPYNIHYTGDGKSVVPKI